MKTIQILSFILFIIIINSCNDDEIPAYIHDHAGIEEIIITRTNEDGSNPVEFTYSAENTGETEIILNTNEIYNFEITAINAHHNGEEENLLPEIIEAKDEHFFVFQKSNALDLFSFVRNDDASTTRSDGNKLGLKFRITTGSNSAGTFQIEMKHQPREVNDDANNGYGSAIGGATDLLAPFSVTIN